MAVYSAITGPGIRIYTTKPALSVIIPTYNRKESLRTTLQALAHQTYPAEQFEVVVVSDGSTDGTNAFLREYAVNTLHTLRIIVQANGGPARARNRGIELAQGDIIIFLDDDVEARPTFLAAHAAHHERDDKVVVIGPMLPDPARRSQEPPWVAWEHAMLEKQYANWRNGVWKGAGPNHFYTGNASLRREHILAVGGFDETFTRQEDVELAYRMARERDVHFLFDPGAIGIHRPVRNFASWLRVPYAYGQLDVVRARRGDASWDVVRHAYYARSRVTRMLASLVLRFPRVAKPLRSLLLLGTQACYRLGYRDGTIGGLSVVYNLRYLEGARAEMEAGLPFPLWV